MRRYNKSSITSLSLSPSSKGVWSLLLTEGQLGRTQDNWDGKCLAAIPGWIAHTRRVHSVYVVDV